MNGTQLSVADVSATGGVSSFDAALIARYAAALGPPTGISGEWILQPSSNTHASITADITGEDYTALLMGEVSGNWANTGDRPANWPNTEGSGRLAVGGGPERDVNVDLPNLVMPVGKEIVVPVTVQGVTDKGIISYEFDLRYDPAVMMPHANAVDLEGTVSRGLMAVVNANEAGLLRVVLYGAMPLDGNGFLLNLRFTAVGAAGSVSPLVFERIMFNEGEPRATVTDGQLELF